MHNMNRNLKNSGWYMGLLLAGMFLGDAHPVAAQCDRVGKVTSVQPGCGITITDLDNGEVLRVVDGTSVLTGGEVVSFHAIPDTLPAACPPGNLPVVAFSCLSSALPCDAHFGFLTDDNYPLSATFHASIYDPQTQNCSWDFGDGMSANGQTVHHDYVAAGTYTVCLKVWDALGCSDHHCETIVIGAASPPPCGYAINVTAINNLLVGKLYTSNPGASQVTSVKWYTDKSNQVLSTAPAFEAPIPVYGTYLVCADFETVNTSDGSVCSGTACKQLTIAEPGVCLNPPLASAIPCQPVASPVCGCDGVSYGNECDAMGAGLSSWWAGGCNNVYGPCKAELEANVVQGLLDGSYSVLLTNKSTGDFSFLQLDYGDGSSMLTSVQWDTITHKYAKGGIYRITLSVWKTDSFVSVYTKMLVTDASNLSPDKLPPGTDYVMPGDANGDLKANVYDLMNIGVGYDADGAPRPFASVAWTPQYAPNWSQLVTGGPNYKHLDCDGNGNIQDFDVDVIDAHYSPIDSTAVPVVPELPLLQVQFALDTIVVNVNNPTPVSIEGDVVVGTPELPALGLYGLAFGLQYPEYVEHDPETYYINDFFGTDNHVLSLRKDNYARQQLDMGFVRKNHLNTAGYGRIAKVTFKADFIVIVDVVGRESSKIKPFAIPVVGLKGIDLNGFPKGLTVPAHLDTVWIKLQGTTATNNLKPESVVYVYPNPAQDVAAVYTGQLAVNRMEVFNALGQPVQTVQPSGNLFTRIDVKSWNKGVYTVEVRTDEGVAVKRIVVQ
jgi:PKD repeat protein